MSSRGRGGRGSRGGGSGGSTGRERDPKQPILDLNKYIDKQVRVKFSGGREVTGTLKGYDQLLNLVMDNVEEHLRDPETLEVLTDSRRSLGLVVLRGTALVVINPVDGFESIENPFAES